MSESLSGLTPLMQQYFAIKKEFADAILLFQVGDFYELFFEDAKVVSSFLGITLTKRGTLRGEPIPLCGVPLHTVDHHLAKLVKGGFKVVICDQLEEATPGKVVKRGVTQVLTPGTLTDTKLLDAKKASYILFFAAGQQHALIFVELLTGQLYTTCVEPTDEKALEAELCRFFPDEIICAPSATSSISFFKKYGYSPSIMHEYVEQHVVDTWVQTQFGQTQPVDHVTMLLQHDSLKQAISLLYGYFLKNNNAALEHIKEVYAYKGDDFLYIDAATQKNLELIENNQDGSRKNSLFSIMDNAVTSMGSRMIRKWILRPLRNRDHIQARLDAVEALIQNIACKEQLIICLKQIADLERVVGRIALQKAQRHDYIHLKEALGLLPTIREHMLTLSTLPIFNAIAARVISFDHLHALLHAALTDDLSSDWIIKSGFDDKLDTMRVLVHNTQQKILALEQQEIEATGIASLKIRFNDVAGYYIELTKTHSDSVPDYYKRTQTLANRERFTIPALQQLEADVEKAKREIVVVEQELYARVKREVLSYSADLKRAAYGLAHLDALIGFAEVAYNNNYVRPQFNDHEISISDGKHPIVAQSVASFIPNGTHLHQQEQLWVITGPNMGGKSTYLRQVALLCLMAQCGSFVPAAAGNFMLLDRIFTRIGAGDNVAEGKSTFFVEMEETATICKQATKNSLVILDEVGRGTTTYDGLAIAQAVVEYIYTNIGAFCLFATHYHELTLLEKQLPGIVCYYATSKQTEQGILFLHKIEKGCAQGSFGLEVARLAQLPSSIIARARDILETISHNSPAVSYVPSTIVVMEKQLAEESRLVNLIQAADLDNMTPRMAYDFLWKLKEQH